MFKNILMGFLLPLSTVIGINNASAQTKAPVDSTVIEEEGPKEGLTISGYADVYYTYNTNRPKYAPGFAWQNEGRIFDIKHNQFSIGLVQAKFNYVKKRSEVMLDLVAGPNAELGNFGNIFGSMIAIKQAYLAYKLTDKLTVTAGQFGTHIGYELIDAPLNTNYSLSYLFGNGPFYHTGLKAAYSVSDKFGVMAGIVNGWDALWSFNKHKSAIAQIYIAPVEDLNIYINYVGGDNKNSLSFPTTGSPSAPIGDSLKTPSHLFDLTGTYQLTEKFKVGLNAAYGFGKLIAPDPTSTSIDYTNATWYGAALYLNYAFTDGFTLSLRSEHFSDKDGVRYIGASNGPGEYNEFTLTGDVSLDGGNLHLKPEFRIDIANKDAFHKRYDLRTGTYSSLTNIQPTIGMAAVYSF